MSEGFLSLLRRYFFGQDVFISYARSDARDYGRALATILLKQGYTCGGEMYVSFDAPSSITRSLKQSSLLVILGTQHAAESPYIRAELEEFLKLGRPVLPIDFDGALQHAEWAHLIDGIAWASETEDALRTAAPSESVVYQIERILKYKSQMKRLRRAAAGTLSIIVLLGVLTATGVEFFRQRLSSFAQETSQARTQLADAQTLLSKKEMELQTLENQLSARTNEVHKLTNELMSARSSNPSDSGDSRQRIANLTGELTARNAEVFDLKSELFAKNSEVKELKNQLAQEQAKSAPTPFPSSTPSVNKEEASWNVIPFLTAFGLIATYVLVCALLLYIRPLWILKFHERLSADKVFDGNLTTKLAKLLVAIIGIDYFAKHSRTRNAWLDYYRFKNGKFSELPPSIRAEYIKHDDALDVWASEHRDRAQKALERIEFLKQRKLFIPLPIEVKPERQLFARPKSNDFGYLFRQEGETIVEIVGRGGSGKSTFAGQLASWSLEQQERSRLMPHYMIPVFIQG